MTAKKNYTLGLQRKIWNLDKEGKVKVIRYGFPIAPDFGGTAHAYCGATMSATSGDLLPWSKKPTLEDMLRAYIIRSRVKQADKIMLAQPYSPHLFRQDLLPEPQLLLDLLLEKLDDQVKKHWAILEKKGKDKTTTEWEISNLLFDSGI